MGKPVAAALAVALLTLAVEGCGGGGGDLSSRSEHITQSALGAQWPLTVSAGTLTCRTPPSQHPHFYTHYGAVTFTADDGTVYWLNGVAKDLASRMGSHDVKPIHKRQKPLRALILIGLQLCPSHSKYYP